MARIERVMTIPGHETRAADRFYRICPRSSAVVENAAARRKIAAVFICASITK
jgi:hypothetical protein